MCNEEARRCKPREQSTSFVLSSVHNLLAFEFRLFKIHLYFSFISDKLLLQIKHLYIFTVLPVRQKVTQSKTAKEKGCLFAVNLNKRNSDMSVN